MAANDSWFPNKNADRYAMIMRTYQFMNITANRAAIGFEATSKNGIWFDAVVYPELDNYLACYDTYTDPVSSTPVNYQALKDAEKALFPLYRQFHAMVVSMLNITNGQLEEMGFPTRSSGQRQPHPVSSAFISVKLIPTGNLAINIAFEDRDTGKSTIPYYLTGAVIFYKISNVAITDQNELSESELATRSPYRKEFDPIHRGKYLSVAARWQNRRGEKGPWSEISTIVIP